MSQGFLTSDFSSNQLGSVRSSMTQEPDIKFPLSSDRNAHQSDNTCTTCSCKYDIPGLAHTRKSFCHFCYRGTCQRCLSYEYYHSESGSFEPMCASCHAKLAAMSDSFLNDIKECRLERMELKKEINLAMQERKFIEEERKMKEEELAQLKNSMDLLGIDEQETLNELKKNNKKLKKTIKAAKDEVQVTEYLVQKLDEEYHEKRREKREYRRARKREEAEYEELKDKLHEYELMNAAFVRERDQVVTEEMRIEEIKTLKAFIDRLKHKIEKKHEKNENLRDKLHHLQKEIEKNKEIIDDIEERTELVQSRDPNMLTDEENKRLDELKKQLKELDEVINLNEQRLESRKSHGKKIQTMSIGSYTTSSQMSHSKDKSNNSNKQSGEQSGCCTKCSIQ